MASLVHSHGGQSYSFSPSDLSLLGLLTQDSPSSHRHPHPPPLKTKKTPLSERRPPVDPLMVAAASASGPDMTRNHYLHDFFPHKLAYASCDDERPLAPVRPKMVSQQAPRRVRLASEEAQKKLEDLQTAQRAVPSPLPLPTSSPKLPSSPPAPSTSLAPPASPSKRRQSVSDPAVTKLLRQQAPSTSPSQSASTASPQKPVIPPALKVECQVRTRIPTPHGHIFLHLYKNNHDSKEHLAFVADHAQMNAQLGETGPSALPFIRSHSLDAVWREGETDMERIVRGAYVGRLSATEQNPSHPAASTSSPLTPSTQADELEPPLVRIHSECFTGETIGSQRCDCGEQLDEAFRLITEAGRGVVVYLRQEGRGIGLLEKMRAYNLQDLGHDTVTANLLLGHGADLRTYDIAGAILRDLAINDVKLLTNNPDKIEQIEKEGVTVVERVAMVPRSWVPVKRKSGKASRARKVKRDILSGAALLALAEQQMMHQSSEEEEHADEEDEAEDDDDDSDDYSMDSDASHNLRRSGVGMIGASVTRSAELDKYLRTKVERMGHLLSLPSTPPSSRAESPNPNLRRLSHKPKAKSGHERMASSIVSLATDPGSVECGSGCEECEMGGASGIESTQSSE